MGSNALFTSNTGQENTAIGDSSLLILTTGSRNVAFGQNAGKSVTTGNDNILISNAGDPSDNGAIRIGAASAQTKAFIAGIKGVTTANNDALAVVIDSAGQLGTTSSSRAVKWDILDMADTTHTLMDLRPVTFRYLGHGAEGPVQYGLVAEEVAEVAPDLVARGSGGEVRTVYYDKVNVMLLKQVQIQQRLIEQLQAEMADLRGRVHQ